MRALVEIITLAFMLVGLFLILSRGRETTDIISSLGKWSVEGVKTLQGRG